MASPMLQEIFGGRLIGLPELGFTRLDLGQKVAIAAGFAGLLSLFIIWGRLFWARPRTGWDANEPVICSSVS